MPAFSAAAVSTASFIGGVLHPVLRNASTLFPIPHRGGRKHPAILKSGLAALTLTLAASLGGCSMSVLGDDAPKTTGSIQPAVDVKGPLPPTLAYSDAAKIGEAANAVLARSGDPQDWINGATGSSGTVEAMNEARTGGCHPFSTTVTSIGGVHDYAGALCPTEYGRPSVVIDEHAATDRS
jgi:hypothetical protein